MVCSSVSDSRGIPPFSHFLFFFSPVHSATYLQICLVIGTNIWIKWAGETKVKELPMSNIDEIVSIESRSRRNRRKTNHLANSPSIDRYTDIGSQRKKPRYNNHIEKLPKKVTTSPRQKTSSSRTRQKVLPMAMTTSSLSASKPKLQKYFGPDIPILSHETDKKQYFLKTLFRDKLVVSENPLDGTKTHLDRIISFNGVKYHLLFSREKELGIQSSKFEKMTNKRYLAYYVGGEGFESASDLKKKLEELGDFSKLALEPGKICSRLELTVSPACTQYNGVYKMKIDDFEQIKENGHVGE